MECRDAQFYLRLHRHATDELGADVSGALSEHLARCPMCAADSRAAFSFDRAIATAMKAVPVPSMLREKLITHVASKQGAILRGRLYRAAVGAAAAIVLAFLGLSVFSTTRPKLDPQALADLADNQLSQPDDYTRKWLSEQKLPEQLPVNFDYELVTHRGFDEVQGNKVPVIVFSSPNGKDFAKVYIFRKDGRFDLKDVRTGQSSRASADVYEFQNAVYVIVYTGGPQGLQQFLNARNPGGPNI